MRILSVLTALILLTGCSSILSVPKTEASEVTFPLTITINKDSKQVQAELEALIKRHEGFSQHPYKDRNDVSVGYGRNLTTNGISEEEALYLLRNDVARIKKALSKKFPVFDELTNPRRAVMVSMAYGLGVEGVSDFALLWESLERRNYDKAALEIYLSSYCTQVRTRCFELAAIMETGDYDYEKHRK